MLNGYTMGGFIHIFLAIAFVMVLASLIRDVSWPRK